MTKADPETTILPATSALAAVTAALVATTTTTTTTATTKNNLIKGNTGIKNDYDHDNNFKTLSTYKQQNN